MSDEDPEKRKEAVGKQQNTFAPLQHALLPTVNFTPQNTDPENVVTKEFPVRELFLAILEWRKQHLKNVHQIEYSVPVANCVACLWVDCLLHTAEQIAVPVS